MKQPSRCVCLVTVTMLPLLLGGNDVYALSLYLSLHEAKDAWKNLSAKIDYCLWHYRKKSVTLQQLFY